VCQNCDKEDGVRLKLFPSLWQRDRVDKDARVWGSTSKQMALSHSLRRFNGLFV
jgi:hypothetical protein